MAKINTYVSVSFYLDDTCLDQQELIEKIERGESIEVDTFVDIDVDLDEFDTEDLIEELETRMNVSSKDDKLLKNFANQINDGGHEEPKTLVDTMIFDLFHEKWQTKTLEEFEKFFNVTN